ncbi:hypothetical protein E2C01_094680 [Portunus trituberculatus]|uniref:Uncharacterized protein n=1 Tax=Portunus trituberculatus TaxID=210409 RepID=A0A5B7JYA7_PORTR|nr:hypothetical protein [Portunus trituberculatus]
MSALGGGDNGTDQAFHLTGGNIYVHEVSRTGVPLRRPQSPRPPFPPRHQKRITLACIRKLLALSLRQFSKATATTSQVFKTFSL